MNKLMSLVKKRYFIFIGMLVALLFFVVFLPMRTQLKKQAIENYRLLSDAKLQTLIALANRCTSAANSVSSRSVIRDYIVSYQDGAMDWYELERQTNPKYKDGIKVIQHLVVAARYVKGSPLVVFGRDGVKPGPYNGLFVQNEQTQYRFLSEGERTLVAVYSPVLYQQQAIGHDIVVVDISGQMRELSGDGFSVRILAQGDALLRDILPNHIYERYPIDKSMHMAVAQPIGEGFFVLTTKPAGEVFASIDRVMLLSIVGFALGLALIFIELYTRLVRLADGMIKEIGFSRDAYMRYANYDVLTGAYTRVFFDNWTKDPQHKLEERKLVVAMIDVDAFKKINDTYGHKTGDDVLIFIAHALMQTVRERDFVVRFGGDEFIIVFEGVAAEKVHKIFDRIDKTIAETNPFEFPIRISHGIAAVESMDTIHESIKQADEMMYRNKNKSKGGMEQS